MEDKTNIGREAQPRETLDIVLACRLKSATAIRVITDIMETSDNEKFRLQAALAVLDRGWGKPMQPVANNNSGEIVFKWQPLD